mgnify:CR=1 FL=1
MRHNLLNAVPPCLPTPGDLFDQLSQMQSSATAPGVGSGGRNPGQIGLGISGDLRRHQGDVAIGIGLGQAERLAEAVERLAAVQQAARVREGAAVAAGLAGLRHESEDDRLEGDSYLHPERARSTAE